MQRVAGRRARPFSNEAGRSRMTPGRGKSVAIDKDHPSGEGQLAGQAGGSLHVASDRFRIVDAEIGLLTRPRLQRVADRACLTPGNRLGRGCRQDCGGADTVMDGDRKLGADGCGREDEAGGGRQRENPWRNRQGARHGGGTGLWIGQVKIGGSLYVAGCGFRIADAGEARRVGNGHVAIGLGNLCRYIASQRDRIAVMPL